MIVKVIGSKLDLNKNKTNLEKKMYRWEKNGETLFKEFNDK